MLPSKVVICGIPHTIELCKDNYNQDLHLGQVTYAKAQIRINDEATEEMQMQSLFHEMLHAMLVLTGNTVEAGDERLVQSLANAMYQSFELRRY